MFVSSAERFTDLRSQLRVGVEYNDPFPTSVDVAYILVTDRCPVGCAFCDVEATMGQGRMTMSAGLVRAAIAFFHDLRIGTLVISGGDPFVALAPTIELIRCVDAENVEVITSGFWAPTLLKARKGLQLLYQAAQDTRALNNLRVRVSIDRWHLPAGKVTLSHYENLLEVVTSEFSGKIQLYFRSIIGDTTVEELARRNGYSLVDVQPPYLKRLHISPSVHFNVQYKNIRNTTRNGNRIDSVEGQATYSVEHYLRRIRDDEGRLRPGLTYDYHEVIRLNHGLNLELFSNGNTKIYGTTPPDNIVNVSTHSFHDAVSQWKGDILVRAALVDGLDYLMRIAVELQPSVLEMCLATNDYSMFPEVLFGTEARRLFITIRTIQDYLVSGRATLQDISPEVLMFLSHSVETLKRICTQHN